MILANLKKQKILIVGPPDTGKTSLVARLVKKRFEDCNTTTIGVDFTGYVAQMDGYGGEEVGLELWDFAGDPYLGDHFLSLIATSDAIMFCFDASDPNSLKQLERWIQKANEKLSDCCKLVVATKCDKLSSPRQHVQMDRINQQFKCRGYDFIRTSAKTGMNVEASFLYLAREIASTKRQDKAIRLLSRRRTCRCC